jgi:hypothetical protein
MSTDTQLAEASFQEQFFLIRYCAEPGLGSERKRLKKCFLRVLYQMHLLQKNVERGAWNSVFPAVATIAKWSGLSETAVHEVLRNPGFSIFCEIQDRPGHTNVYRLKRWVFEFFKAFEKVGLMRGFLTDFNAFFKRFCKRCDTWFSKIVESCQSINELMNKLSTKPKLKVQGSESLKTHPTTRPGTFTTPRRVLEEDRKTPMPIVKEVSNLVESLRDRFKLQEREIHKTMNDFPLNEIKAGSRVVDSWMKRGMKVVSPIKVLMKAISNVREAKRARQSL